MIYLKRQEVRQLFAEAYRSNRLHHLFLLTAFWHAPRVSELLDLDNRDVFDGQLSLRRRKQGKTRNGRKASPRTTVQPLHRDTDPLFDQSPLEQLAQERTGRLFPFTRQYADRLIKLYGRRAGLHPAKCHMHALRHSLCVLLWQATRDISAVQDWVGHKSPASTLVYMRHDASQRAGEAVQRMKIF